MTKEEEIYDRLQHRRDLRTSRFMSHSQYLDACVSVMFEVAAEILAKEVNEPPPPRDVPSVPTARGL